MTLDEKDKLYDEVNRLKKKGELEKAMMLAKTIPIAPDLLLAAKEVCGADYVKNSGFNLSEAEEVYGEDWLDR